MGNCIEVLRCRAVRLGRMVENVWRQACNNRSPAEQIYVMIVAIDTHLSCLLLFEQCQRRLLVHLAHELLHCLRHKLRKEQHYTARAGRRPS